MDGATKFFVGLIAVILGLALYGILTTVRESQECQDKGGIYVKDFGGFTYKCVKAEEVK